MAADTERAELLARELMGVSAGIRRVVRRQVAQRCRPRRCRRRQVDLLLVVKVSPASASRPLPGSLHLAGNSVSALVNQARQGQPADPRDRPGATAAPPNCSSPPRRPPGWPAGATGPGRARRQRARPPRPGRPREHRARAGAAHPVAQRALGRPRVTSEAVRVPGLRYSFRETVAVDGVSLDGPARRDLRPARAQRRRQDHHDPRDHRRCCRCRPVRSRSSGWTWPGARWRYAG